MSAFDWFATDKLTIKGSALYFESDGQSDVVEPEQLRQSAADQRVRQLETDVAQPEGDLRAQQELVVHRRLRVRAIRYSDIAFDGYQYTLPFPGVTNSTTQSYLNGYRAFTNADANIFYLLATYKFDLRRRCPARRSLNRQAGASRRDTCAPATTTGTAPAAPAGAAGAADHA